MRTVGMKEEYAANQVGDKFTGMDVEQLKAYASEHNIDIGNATTANGIVKKIAEAEKN